MPPDETNDQTSTEQTPPATEEASQESELERIRNIYNAALAEASQRATFAENELQRVRSQPAPEQAKSPDPETDRQNFFDNPRQLIREEMTQIVKPLNEFQQRFSRQEAYNSFLAKAASHPMFAHINNPIVQQSLSNMAGTMNTITDEGLSAAYNMVVGHLFSQGQLTQAAPPAPLDAPQTNNQMQPPPNPRPVAPLAPVSANAPKKITLSEHEKQLARFNNMTDEEYHMFLHMDKADVVSSMEVK